MPKPEEIEIYRQRYDTFRHLDRLRWQVLQIAVGGSALTMVFARDGSNSEWWVLVAVGLMLVLFGITMLRIGIGVNRNNEVLNKIGMVIGDTDIPPITRWYRSISFWIPIVLIVAGCLSVMLGGVFYFQMKECM